MQVLFVFICLSDVGEHSKFKQPYYPSLWLMFWLSYYWVLPKFFRIIGNTSLHLSGFPLNFGYPVFSPNFYGKKKKKTTHANCNLCLIPLMLLNIPSVSVDVTHVPRARKTSPFQGLLSSDSITTETHKYQMENRILCPGPSSAALVPQLRIAKFVSTLPTG